MRKRIFSLILTCVVLCTCVFGSITVANAAWSEPVNYTDLDYSVRYGNEVNIVRFNIPAEHFMFQVSGVSLDSTIKIMGKDTCYVFGESGYFDFEFFPLTTYGLILENVPVGTKLHVGAKISSDLWYEKGYTKAYQRARYMDKDSKWLSNKVTEIDYSNKSFTSIGERECYRPTDIALDYVIENFTGSNSFVPAYRMVNAYSPQGSFIVTVSSCYIEMEVTVDYWTQFQTKLNGEKLDQINDTLNDQWNADIEGSSPEGSDVVENADKVESEIRDEAQAGLDKGAEIQQEAGNILKSDNVAQALLCSVKIFETFANIPFFTNLLVVSVSLGIFALLVNLANSFASWHRGNVREAQREQRRQEAAERYGRKHR